MHSETVGKRTVCHEESSRRLLSSVLPQAGWQRELVSHNWPLFKESPTLKVDHFQPSSRFEIGHALLEEPFPISYATALLFQITNQHVVITKFCFHRAACYHEWEDVSTSTADGMATYHVTQADKVETALESPFSFAVIN